MHFPFSYSSFIPPKLSSSIIKYSFSLFSNEIINSSFSILKVTTLASKFTSQCYTVKHFGLGEAKAEANQTVDGTDTAPKTFTVNNFMWNSLWLLNSATFSANGISTNPPSLLRQDGDLNFIDDLDIPELSWKQVLIAILEGLWFKTSLKFCFFY